MACASQLCLRHRIPGVESTDSGAFDPRFQHRSFGVDFAPSCRWISREERAPYQGRTFSIHAKPSLFGEFHARAGFDDRWSFVAYGNSFHHLIRFDLYTGDAVRRSVSTPEIRPGL